MAASFPRPPFKLDLDVSVSTFRCAGHGVTSCPVVVTPGEPTTGLRKLRPEQPAEPAYAPAARLCPACGRKALDDLVVWTRLRLLEDAATMPWPAEPPTARDHVAGSNPTPGSRSPRHSTDPIVKHCSCSRLRTADMDHIVAHSPLCDVHGERT